MYFNKAQKLCFFEPPKTGTRTAQAFLRSSGWHFLAPDHGLPEEYLERHPNLIQYKAYMFLRNPLDRFISLILFIKQSNLALEFKSSEVLHYTYEKFVDVFDFVKSRFPILSRAQSCWATHPTTEVLDFHNYEAEIRRITGNTEVPLVIRNKSTAFGKSAITQKVIDFVRQEYAADYELAKSRLGKEY